MKKTNSRTSLFLGEIVLSLLIFALSAAVCVGLLFRAYHISGASGELNQAVFYAQSAAETFKAQPELAKMTELLGGSLDSDTCYVYYDGNWQPAQKQEAVFTQSVSLHEEAGVQYADIRMLKGSAVIFQLTAASAGEGS